MYGHRARIGYTSPPLTTEVFPYEFYKIVPDGRDARHHHAGHRRAQQGRGRSILRDQHEGRARDGGGRGATSSCSAACRSTCRAAAASIEQMIRDLEAELEVKVSTSAAAQAAPPRRSAARRSWWRSPMRIPTPTVSPATPIISAAKSSVRPAGAARSTRSAASRSTPPSRLGRKLMREHPDADTILLPSPHWPTAHAIDVLEREFGVNVVARASGDRVGRAAALRRQR